VATPLVETDIPRYPHGKGPREFFRDRAFAKLVLTDSGATVGDVVIFEKLGSHEFRLHLERPNGHRHSGHLPPSEGEVRVRKWVERDSRPDQRNFRRGIVDRDGLRCAISRCEVPDVLDAAHLDPHAGGGSSDPSNGMILRVDLHRLFDAGWLIVDQAGKITVPLEVANPEYRQFHGRNVSSGADLTNLLRRGTS